MRDANDNAHRDIERFLKSGNGLSISVIGGVLGWYRGQIMEHATELAGYFDEETTRMLIDNFPEAPPPKQGGRAGNPIPQDGGNHDRTTDQGGQGRRAGDPIGAAAAGGCGLPPIPAAPAGPLAGPVAESAPAAAAPA